MPMLHANGIALYYEDGGGAGEPVVLIHGHSVDRRMWAAQWLALREAGFRVIRYDVRGHGRSSAPDTGYTWPVYAADLCALLDALGVAAAHLVGFSMCGGIALQFALDHPARARSLALIDAAVPGFAYSADFADTIEALVAVQGWEVAARAVLIAVLAAAAFLGTVHALNRRVLRDVGDLVTDLLRTRPFPRSD